MEGITKAFEPTILNLASHVLVLTNIAALYCKVGQIIFQLWFVYVAWKGTYITEY